MTFDRVNFVLRQTPEKVLYNVKRFSDLSAAITGGPLRRDIAGKLSCTEQTIGNI